MRSGYAGVPTIRKRIIGKHLRMLREDAGCSMEDVASNLGISRTAAYRQETGHVAVKVSDVRAYMSLYTQVYEEYTGLSSRMRELGRRLEQLNSSTDSQAIDKMNSELSRIKERMSRMGPRIPSLGSKVHDPAYAERMEQLARNCRKRGWWTRYNDAVGPAHVDLADAEDMATSIYYGRSAGIPPLLEVDEYAQAELDKVRPILESQGIVVDHSLDLRRRRKEVMDRESPPEIVAVLGEACVLTTVGNDLVMREQIRHLIHMSHHPHVSVQIMPFSRGYVCGHGPSLTVMKFGNILEGSVTIDAMGAFNDDPDVAKAHLDAFEDDRKRALSPDDSRKYLQKLLSS